MARLVALLRGINLGSKRRVPMADLRELMEKLRAGSDINWIPFWKEFGQMVTDKEGFSDYIPPHKNLGAIFIKAYKTQMGEDEDNSTASF